MKKCFVVFIIILAILTGCNLIEKDTGYSKIKIIIDESNVTNNGLFIYNDSFSGDYIYGLYVLRLNWNDEQGYRPAVDLNEVDSFMVSDGLLYIDINISNVWEISDMIGWVFYLQRLA